MEIMNFSEDFISNFSESLRSIDLRQVDAFISQLRRTRDDGGRVFVLGVGGSAANSSHMVNDLRKLAGIEAYAATDNVAELTARINDEGWSTSFAEWLKSSRLGPRDCICILSVGGGNKEKNISMNLIEAIDFALEIDASVIGIVGRSDGYLASINLSTTIIAGSANPDQITPVSESMQAIIWHLAVSDPRLKLGVTKW
jgi:D-sedoheptulose 7-phosphate isomerase